MFQNINRVLTLIAAMFAAVVIFFYFHGAVALVGGKARHVAKIASGQASLMAPSQNYDLVISGRTRDRSRIPPLPDISGYTVENIAAMAPPYRSGKVFVRGMTGLAGVREFIKKDGRVQNLRIGQLSVDPQVILIQEGDYDLEHLYDEVKAIDPDALVKQGDIYILHKPILVDSHASLTISDRDTSEVKLSQDKGVFLANAGRLFILRTKITGWNEKEGHPSYFKERTIFRPFIASWSGARLYMAGSTVSSLGYRKGKSYGLTYSSSEYLLANDPNLPRPTGALVGNVFTDMYYGFYSYEADDIAIVSNLYYDNAVYAIDPHDRSRRLIIAGNETRGSHKKHGIIISRNVDDSWIFNNYTHHNHGSGIMLDRTSRNNVIANNITAYNEGDGITFFESPDNVTYNNKVYRNGMSGFRIRNSWNIRMVDDQISDNGRVPVVVYAMDLSRISPDRDLKEDAYTQKAGAAAIGTVVKLADRKPVFKIDGIENLTLSDLHIVSAGTVFADNLFPEETDISGTLEAGKTVTVRRKSL